ncbi:MAG: hypothetical protein JNK82_44700 [Myxococcaceae bacterium]|nr:hypothetical protein [Myxococcaceae bacterium]
MRSLFFVTVLFSSSLALAQKGAADLSGTYAANGANPGGEGKYSGEVKLTKSGDTYNVEWALANSPPYKGVALQSGELLGVGWGMGAAFGVVVYKVNGGKLSGRWATASSGPKAGTEELEGPPGLSGTYKITKATTPDGKPYKGEVSITPNGDVYEVTWTLPKEKYSGVAIKQGELLIVGWGAADKAAGVVSYRVGANGMEGVWGAPGSKQLGTEKLLKK